MITYLLYYIYFPVNVMDLDLDTYLTTSKPKEEKKQPSQKKKPSKKTEVKKSKKKNDNDIFSAMGLQTIDDLGVTDSGDDVEIKMAESEREYESDFDPVTYSEGRTPSPLRSILSPTPRSTPRSGRGRGRVHYSLEEVTEVRSRSPSPEVISTARGSITSIVYTEDFDDDDSASEIVTASRGSVDDSQTDTSYHHPRRRRHYSNEYSDDFTSASESRGRHYSRSSSVDSETGSYTESFTSYTSRSR